MKTLAIVALFGVGLIGLAYITPATQDIVVNREEVTHVEVEVVPNWAQDEDAVQAAKDVIRRKELEAELLTLQEEVTIRENRIVEIEKELGSY